MEMVTCPYCQSKVRMSDVEMNDGACPECGAPITGSLLFSDEGSTAAPGGETNEAEEDEEGQRRGEDEESVF